MNKLKSNIYFSIYPLTKEFSDKLKSNYNLSEFEFIDLSSIRKKGLLKAVFYFVKLKVLQIFLVSESDESEDLLSVLKFFAMISSASKIFIVDKDLNQRSISRISILGSVFLIIRATISGIYSVIYAWFELLLNAKNPPEDTYKIKGKNILYLNMNLWYGVKVGGSVGHIAGVANELLRRHYYVHYAAISDSNSLDKDIERVLLKSPISFGLPPEVNNYRFDLFNYKRIKRLIEKNPPSFIYQRLSVCCYNGAKIANKLNIPLIVEYNGSEVWIAKNWGRPLVFEKIAKMAETVMLKRANVIVTISEVLKEELISRGISSDKIVYYPNSIDPLVFDPIRFPTEQINELKMSLNCSEDTKLITFLGTFGQWHGVDVLAEVICELSKNNKAWLIDNKVKFLLVGDGLKMSLVRNILQSSSESLEFCILTGLIPQNKAPLYLAASDILISPHISNPDGTRFFGSPTKLFEYLAMGRAVLASDLEQIGEVLKNSINIESLESLEDSIKYKRVAYLTEPGNISKLSKSIIHLINNPELRAILGRNARELALEKYTWEKHVDAIISKLK